MNTSRKLMVNWTFFQVFSKTQMCSKERHLNRSSLRRSRAQTNQIFHLRDAGKDPEENCHCPLRTHRYSVCLLLSLAIGPKIICSTQCTFQSQRQAHPAKEPENTGNLSHTKPAYATETFLGCHQKFCCLHVKFPLCNLSKYSP